MSSVGEAASEQSKLTFRRVIDLIVRCWPYYRPQLKHVVAYLLMNVFVGTIMIGVAFVGSDLWYNKVLDGNPLEESQAAYLFLDDSYLAQGGEDEVLTTEQREQVLLRIFVGAALYAALLMASFAGTGTYVAWIYQRINQALRARMIRQVEHLSLGHHAHTRTGDTIYRVYQDSATITNVLQFFIVTPLRAVGTGLFGIAVMVMFSPWLGLLLAATLVPLGWLLIKYTPTLQAGALRARRSSSNLTSNIQETFTAIKVIKANRAEETALREFDRDSNRALNAAFRFRWHIVLMTTMLAFVSVGALLFAEYWMAAWARAEEATYLGGAIALVGFATWNLGAFQVATGRFADANHHANDVASLWANAQDLSVGLDRAFYLLELEPGVTDPEHPAPFPDSLREIAWRAVDFSYVDGAPVLEGANLAARAGTITAIVGGTGSGKSTLVSLLLRLYDPQNGSVFVNDTDIRDLSIADLRNHVAIALQQNVLFTDSVANNIAYARDDASRDDIEQAARVACADEFIAEIPGGYDAELGDRGGKLSTGQRQRISIARAIVRDTPVLILDEPTASLDAATEHLVLDNIAEWGRDRVVLLITHRLSTIKTADQIAFIEDGAVAEFGTHDELMALAEGSYRRFVEAEGAGA